MEMDEKLTGGRGTELMGKRKLYKEDFCLYSRGREQARMTREMNDSHYSC